MLLYACRRQRLVNGIIFLVTTIFLLTADARIARADGNGNGTVAIRVRRAGSFSAKQLRRPFTPCRSNHLTAKYFQRLPNYVFYVHFSRMICINGSLLKVMLSMHFFFPCRYHQDLIVRSVYFPPCRHHHQDLIVMSAWLYKLLHSLLNC